MTVTATGRRHYISGDTYSLRDQLRAAGCHWDPERRAWWTAKADVAQRFASAQASPQAETIDPRRTPILGRAEYKGRGGCGRVQTGLWRLRKFRYRASEF